MDSVRERNTLEGPELRGFSFQTVRVLLALRPGSGQSAPGLPLRSGSPRAPRRAGRPAQTGGVSELFRAPLCHLMFQLLRFVLSLSFAPTL